MHLSVFLPVGLVERFTPGITYTVPVLRNTRVNHFEIKTHLLRFFFFYHFINILRRNTAYGTATHVFFLNKNSFCRRAQLS